ncbi:MAG: T9SS type A sorting domain-containing protein [Ignavibacteria bacterium]|jgi:hypothetical protein
MKRISYLIPLLVITFLVTGNRTLFAQQLIQSFVQANTQKTKANFGYSVSTAGDVNGDGYDDVIIGAYKYSMPTGRAYIFYGDKNMDTNADVIIVGTGTYFGYSVSNAGDVNKDGYDDVIVGTFADDCAYIIYGNSRLANGIKATEADVILTGSDRFGYSVSSAGDVNKDGYDDVIVGAYKYSNSTGRAYIFYGSEDMDNASDVILTGKNEEDCFGISVSSAGYVNKDGYDDVIVGASDYGNEKGRAYIYYGSTSMDNLVDVTITGEGSDNEFGCSVSNAGDVNGDGHDDVIVGANNVNNSGRAYIFYGGSLSSSIYAENADVIVIGEIAYDRLGSSVSSAGDVNKDGYDDVIIGACSSSRVYIFYGGSSLSGTFDATDADVIIIGENRHNYFGLPVSNAGDVNGDSYDDVIAGAYKYSNYNGRAYILYGSDNLDKSIGAGEADVKFDVPSEDNYFGCSVSSIGDVNDDDIDDIIVGAYGHSTYKGRAYIFYGGSDMDNSADVIITGEKLAHHLGWSASSAGDINNDGINDIIIGAYGYSNSTGRTYIFYGGSLSPTIIASSANVIITGKENFQFGYSVSYAGDVNGDSKDDIIIGAPGYATQKGRAFIFYGGSLSGSISSADANVKITGETAKDYFSCSVSYAGNVNGDSYDDLIIGSPEYDSKKGCAYIFNGGSLSSDIDADNADAIITGTAKGFELGYSVSYAGDVNGDTKDDIIIGAPEYSSSTGRVFIFYGGSLSGSIRSSTANVIMSGEIEGDYFGCSVSYAGNVNGDSYDDVIIGSPGYDSKKGRVYIFYGGSLSSYTNAASANIIMTGEQEYDEFGYSVSYAGDVNNDGYDDVVMGAPICTSNGSCEVYIYSDDAAPMPVELASFTAALSDERVVLKWQTVTEVNNYGFEIERNMSPLEGGTEGGWSKLSFVQGNGNSNSPKSYSYTDIPTGGTTFKYRLKQIDFDGAYEYSDEVEITLDGITEFSLDQNYPNPFNPTTTISYQIPETGDVSLKIYDVLGREVMTLINETQASGVYSVEFNASKLASGVYIYRLKCNDFLQTKKLLLLK